MSTKEKIEHDYRLTIILILILFIGFFFIASPKIFDREDSAFLSFLSTLGITLTTASFVTLVNETILKINFVNILRKAVHDEVLDLMPEKYKNVKNCGIVDAYKELYLSSVQDNLRKAYNAEIRIMNIWIPWLYQYKNELVDAIENRKCKVKVILLNPDSTEAINRRAMSIRDKTKPEQIKANIESNLHSLNFVFSKLNKSFHQNLKLKYSDGFVSTSLLGIGDTIRLGLYLNGRTASRGMQIKVVGPKGDFYKELTNHFDQEWSSSEPVKLESIDIESSD